MQLAVVVVIVLAFVVGTQGTYYVASDPSWDKCSGGPKVACTFSTDNTASPPEKIVSWGTLVVGQPSTSRLKISRPTQALQVVDPGSPNPFIIAVLYHDNWRVEGLETFPTSVSLNINLDITDTEISVTKTFPIAASVAIDETPNTPRGLTLAGTCEYSPNWFTEYGIQWVTGLPCCPYPSYDAPCSDKIEANILSGSSSVQVGNKTYDLKIQGFCNSSNYEDCASSFTTNQQFISQEQKSNKAFIYARFQLKCVGNAQEICAGGLSQSQLFCSSVTCENSYCKYAPKNLNSACDDNNVCTTNEKCQSGLNGQGFCTGTPNTGAVCTLPNQNDYAPCKIPRCSSGGSCQFINAPNTTPCGTNPNTCTVRRCENGVCINDVNSLQGTACNTAGTIPSTRDATCSVQKCQLGTCSWVNAYSDNTQACDAAGSTTCSPKYCVSGKCQVSTSKAPTGNNICNNNPPSCKNYVCSGGSCVLTGYSSSATCPAGLSPDDICQTSKCTSGSCVTVPLTQTLNCTSSGFTYGTVQNQCKRTTCTNGQCTVINIAENAACSYPGYIQSENPCQDPVCKSGICTLVGRSNGNRPSNCNGNTACTQQSCQSGTCQWVNKNDNTLCSIAGITSTNCNRGQCSSGTCVLQRNTGMNNRACTGPYANNATTGDPLQQCKTYLCDTNSNSFGYCVQVLDTNNIGKCPSGSPCTGYSCQTGSCVLFNRSSTTVCPGGSSVPTRDVTNPKCQIERCDGGGTCRVYNEPQVTPCATGSTPECQAFLCSNGACITIPDDSANCRTAPAMCKRKYCSNGNCLEVNDNTASCSNGTLQVCHSWSCQNGACIQVADTTKTCSGSNPCLTYSCSAAGQCVSTTNDKNRCTLSTVPECQVAACRSGTCVAVADSNQLNNACQVSQTKSNTCWKKTCRADGSCQDLSQTGQKCQETACVIGYCDDKVCTLTNINENKTCASDESDLCNRKICQAGSCLPGKSFWDRAFCGYKDNDPCKVLKCYDGECDKNSYYFADPGTNCGSESETKLCRKKVCVADGSCQAQAPDGSPCYDKATYKRQTAPGLDQCEAYVCKSGECLNDRKIFVNDIPCVGNFSSPCLVGKCLDGACIATRIPGCDRCERFTNCESCFRGTYKKKRGVTASESETSSESSSADISSTDSSSFDVEDDRICKMNPNLPGCLSKCSWCATSDKNGACYSLDISEEINEKVVSSTSQLKCPTCPAVIVEEGSSDHTTRNALLGSLIPAGGIAAGLAAAAVIAFFVKKHIDAGKVDTSIAGFEASKDIKDNPIHQKSKEVQTSLLYSG